MRGGIFPLPQYIFMAWCKYSDKLTFTLLLATHRDNTLCSRCDTSTSTEMFLCNSTLKSGVNVNNLFSKYLGPVMQDFFFTCVRTLTLQDYFLFGTCSVAFYYDLT